jgi:anti-sigma factor RsiW
MDTLMQRYLDGDLTTEEATALETRLAADPALVAELQAWEAAMAQLTSPVRDNVSAGFADRVMTAVRAADVNTQESALRRRPTQLRAPAMAMAASLVLCFLGGYLVAERGIVGRQLQAPAAATAIQFAADRSPAGLRVVRLVFPQAGPAQTVTVAGDFNGWQPEGLPLVQRQGVWTIDLALPPGIYEYMFVVDGQQWVTDPLARTTRDDGYGGENAILDLTI